MKCTKCKKQKDISDFQCKDNTKIFKNCLGCRLMSQTWRDKNKDRVHEYNKMTIINKNNKKTLTTFTYARKINSEEWIRYKSQRAASHDLNLFPSNVNKVIKGELQSTGGYEFKVETENKIIKSKQNWNEIKKEHNFIDNCKGQPSNHRTCHEIIDNVEGKKCCTCKNWKPLVEYNMDSNHWDNLRVECKQCLCQWRKDNRECINYYMKSYESNRKQNDINFKLTKTLRSRLGTALKSQNAKKLNSTLTLTSCTIVRLKEYLESKFQEGMTWENHGQWHIDHIKPCASFKLENEDEQQLCFHYTNLQPLWAKDNLSKGSKII